MQQVDEELVRRVASLSRIRLSEDEVALLVSQFREILDYFSAISSWELPPPSPMDRLVELANVFREDQPTPQSKDLTGIFPNREGRYIKAPKIV